MESQGRIYKENVANHRALGEHLHLGVLREETRIQAGKESEHKKIENVVPEKTVHDIFGGTGQSS